MKRHRTILTSASIGLALLGVVSCGGGENASSEQSARVETNGPTHPLGWLGGRARAATDLFTFEVDGQRHDTGGMVLESLVPSSPLATAGARAGDVIVGVAEEWLPIVDDPWLDLIEAVETTISSGASAMPLQVQRDGRLTTIELAWSVKTLEEGLPLEVVRFDEGAERALEALDPGADSDLGSLAWAGLARLAAGRPPEEVSLAKLSAGRARPDDDTLSTSDLVAAVMLETERLGPLPANVVTRASLKNLPFGDALGGSVQFGELGDGQQGGVYSSGTISIGGADGPPPDLSELLASGGANIKVFGAGGDPGGGELDPEALREMLNLPEGAEISVMGGSPEELAEIFGGELPDGASFSMEALDLTTLLQEENPERLGAMDELRPWLDRLIARQRTDGSWADEGADPFRATCEALGALGMAQRAGLELPAAAVEKGVAYLRPDLHDGEIAAHVARGGDRRDAVSKSLLAARALELLGCPERDELQGLLVRFLKRSQPGDFDDPRDLLARALQLRAGGIGDWQRFYDEFRVRLVAAQDPDGSFLFTDGGSPADTAIGAVLLSLQHARTPLWIGTATNPLAPPIDGHGRRPELPDSHEDLVDDAEKDD